MILAVAMLMFSMVLATSYGVNVPTNDKKDTGITIESQPKTVSYKITWNGNGGKIGAKKTTITNIKKGSKIGKLATTPKRNGYTFKGWYTKKTGGVKITKNTKVKKNIIYYAQWKKKTDTTTSRALTDEEKKLVGAWTWSGWGLSDVLIFNKDGTFGYSSAGPVNKYGKYADVRYLGNFNVKNGIIYYTNVISATKDGYTLPPYTFEKNDYKSTSNKNGTYEKCTQHDNCLITNALGFSTKHYTKK